MSIVTTLVVTVLALLNLVLFGALLELFRDVRQLRVISGLIDRPLPVSLGAIAGTPPSLHGLPETLDSAQSALVLFLSEKCGTCRVIAESLGGSVPANTWVVVETASSERGREWLRVYGFPEPDGPMSRLVLDVGSNIAARIGIDTTPVGLFVEAGRLTAGTTVPSSRQLFAIVPREVRLHRSAAS